MTRILLLIPTFLSALLLFVVQPLYTKYLLPNFGGTATVWTVSIFFYSSILLLGYLYAYLLTSWPSRQARLVHTLLLVVAGALLLGRWIGFGSPLLTEGMYDGAPALAVFLTLLHTLGLPVFLLSSTAVLTQHLYARYTGTEPYVLYALSNAGSLIGLAIYPFLLEPFVSLSVQAILWIVGFVSFLLMLSSVWRQVELITRETRNSSALSLLAPLRSRTDIIFLAAVPTLLLASLTEFLSRGISSFPFLWVLPLMLYLVSFIAAFRQLDVLTPRVPLGAWVLLALICAMAAMSYLNASAILFWFSLLCLSVSFFTVCLYFHRRIYALRPRVEDLGSFYVYVTLGGALGSGVVAIIFPLVLSDLVELHYTLGLLIIYFTLRYAGEIKIDFPKMHRWGVQAVIILLAISFMLTTSGGVSLAEERNFYGTVRVTERTTTTKDGKEVVIRALMNGVTLHGLEVQDQAYRETPAGYYGPGSGIERAISSFADQGKKPKVVVLGLGPGAIATYCDQLSALTFIDVNPVVEKLAREYFTYLSFCAEKTEIETGDGRLILGSDTERYDIIMMDAFTDDAVPTHLLTVEAFEEAYLPRLSEGGVIVFHISNKYLNLYPPIAGAARSVGYEAVKVVNDPTSDEAWQSLSYWVLVTKPEDVSTLLVYDNAVLYEGREIVWSDEKGSVLQVLSLQGSVAD